MPELKSIEIDNECFKNVSELKLIGMKMLKNVIVGENCFTMKKSENDKESYGLYVKNCELLRELKIGNHSFEEYSVCEIENVGSLELIEVGDECFRYVKEVKLIGLNQLERVVIGMNSFTKKNDWPQHNPDRHFYLKNCERVRELKIGRYSFSDYSVCEIENVPSLEVIEIGELNEESECFWCASLGMKSDSERMK